MGDTLVLSFQIIFLLVSRDQCPEIMSTAQAPVSGMLWPVLGNGKFPTQKSDHSSRWLHFIGPDLEISRDAKRDKVRYGLLFPD
jgi:hypothetical protein